MYNLYFFSLRHCARTLHIVTCKDSTYDSSNIGSNITAHNQPDPYAFDIRSNRSTGYVDVRRRTNQNNSNCIGKYVRYVYKDIMLLNILLHSNNKKQHHVPVYTDFSHSFAIASCKQTEKIRSRKWADCLRMYTTKLDIIAPAQISYRKYNVI